MNKESKKKLKKLLQEMADWTMLYGSTEEGLAKAWQATDKAMIDWKKRAEELLREEEIEASKGISFIIEINDGNGAFIRSKSTGAGRMGFERATDELKQEVERFDTSFGRRIRDLNIKWPETKGRKAN